MDKGTPSYQSFPSYRQVQHNNLLSTGGYPMKKKLVIYSLTSLLAITPVASVFAADTASTTDPAAAQTSTASTSTSTATTGTTTGTTDTGTVSGNTSTSTAGEDEKDQKDGQDSEDESDMNNASGDQNQEDQNKEKDHQDELDNEAKQVIDQFMNKLMEAVQPGNGELNQEKLQEALKEMLQQMKQDGKVKKADSEGQVKQMVKQKLESEIKSGQVSEQQVEFLVSLKLDDNEKDGALATVEEALTKNSASDQLYNLLSEVYKKKGDTEKVKVYVGGKQPNFDVMPFIENGRTMIPVRAVSEALGAAVTWNGDTQTVVISKDGITIELPIGSQAIKVNGVEHVIDAPARVTGDRTVVPVRFISEFLGHQVDFDPTTSLVIVK